MNKYLAITIGPIYKTMALARSTSELWGASYIFSFLTEKLIEKLQPLGTFILPVSDNAERIEAGLFPDRLLILLDKQSEFSIGDFEALKDKLINECFGIKIIPYLQVYSLIISLDDKIDPIQTIMPLLDSMELKQRYVEQYNKNQLKEFLLDIKKWDSFIPNYHFPSLQRIASSDLKRYVDVALPDDIKIVDDSLSVYDKIVINNENDKEEPIIKKLKKIYNKNNEQRFRYYHKYIAIVHADGDNISKALHSIYSIKGVEGVRSFSALLMSFGRKIYEKIKDYDGVPIYLGGDDMLFYAPVRNDKHEQKQHILGLLKDLNDEFIETILNNEELAGTITDWNSGITPYNNRKRVDISLSFGVSIAYTKYPIKETLESSRDLLFKTAKNFPGKNAVSFKLQKHSGQTFDTTWRLFNIEKEKPEVSYNLFLEFVKSHIETDENKLIDRNFLAALQYKLEPLTPLIIRILTGKALEPEKTGFWQIIQQMPDEDEREYFFNRLVDNFFNEVTHEVKRDFINKSFYYLLYHYRELEDIFGNNPETARKAIDNLYACLRYIQFLKQPDSNKEEDML